MERSRRWCPGWFATVAVLAAACSGSSAPGGGADGGGGGIDAGDGGTLPGFDAPPPMGLFPLGVSGDGGSLVTADGTPFLLHGEAAWSLIVQLTATDAMRYLADRHSRGVNAVIVNLIEHFYSDHSPSNAAGAAPFTTPGDFSTPNEAYFAYADQVIDLAASQGMAVLLFPSYLGHTVQEGWRVEMSAMSSVAGAPKCAGYGRFLGQRYAAKKNIIWMWGGDDTPTGEPGVETCMKAIRDGILAAEPGTLASAHWAPNTTSRDEPAFTRSLHLVGVYNYLQDLQHTCRDARTDPSFPRMPTYLIETCYEGETIQSCSPAPSEARRRMFWGWLGCGAGQFYGISGMWQFSTGWLDKLGSPVSVSASRLLAIAQQMAWQTLAPDDALVTAGAGSPGSATEVIATRTADRSHAVIYIPPGGASQITVDLTRMRGAVTATWQDPTADHSVPAESNLTGSHVFATPGLNDDRDTDWVLVLSAP